MGGTHGGRFRVRLGWVVAAALLVAVVHDAVPIAGAEDPPPVAPGDPEDLVRRAGPLVATASDFAARGLYDQALVPAKEALALLERARGPEHEGLIGVLTLVGDTLVSLARAEEGAPYLERALAIAERRSGPDDPDVASCLSNLARARWRAGRTAEAKPLLERAQSIYEKAGGPDDPETAMGADNLAVVLRNLGELDRAQALYERALAIREKALGRNDPLTATSLNNLGWLHHTRGRDEEALPLLKRALRIHEKVLGPDHPRTGDSAQNVAQVLQALGRSEEALDLMRRSLAARERTYGNESGWALYTASSLAGMLRETGRYEEARAIYERVLAVRERTQGREHSQTAGSLNDLALLLDDLGQSEAAVPLFRRALAIREKEEGPESAETASVANNLGLALGRVGEAAEAKALVERALAIWTKALGPDRPEVATGMNNLAGYLRELGDREGARRLYDRALEIREHVLGPEHPLTAQSLTALALWLKEEGRYAEARPLYERALAIREKALGPHHVDIALQLHNFAAVLAYDGKYEEARPLFLRALGIVEGYVRERLRGAVGPDRLAVARSVRWYLEAFLRASGPHGESGYPEVLRFKGLVTRVQERERTLDRGAPESWKTAVDAYRATQRRLAALANAVPPARETEARKAWQDSYATLSGEAERQGLALAEAAAARGVAEESRAIGPPEVRTALPEGALLLDFLRLEDRYLVWVVRPGGEEKRVDLGSADAIEHAAEAFVEATRRAPTPTDEAFRAAGAALRSLILGPVDEALRSTSGALYVSPDAALAALPFGALPGREAGRFLLDERPVVLLSMAQDLVPAAAPGPTGRGALLVGGVDFDAAEEGTAAADTAAPAAAPELASLDRAPRGGTFSPLAGSTEEVRALVALLGETAQVVTGRAATEDRLRRAAAGRRILHVATHGFVRSDLRSALAPVRGEQRWLGGLEERRLAGYDPMLLAGVALAGANPRHGGGDDDGILTALEASHLDLGGCDLVVLSACETALGRAESGEGVLGLVQAFQTAGARDVVASLWRVDDDATRRTMERFYRHVTDAERPLRPAEALRRAALSLRDSRPDGRDLSAPRHWAAFVAYESYGVR